MDVSARCHGVFLFGPFRLDPVRRTLLRNGVPVILAPRLFDTLLHLVANHERLVERGELIEAVWGRRLVDDANVNQAIFALRRALRTGSTDDGVIVTAPGRGYRFGLPVEFEATTVPSVDEPTSRAGHSSVAGVADAPRLRSAAVKYGALALTLASVTLWYVRPSNHISSEAATAPFLPPPHSVAVLAFTNLSGDPGQEYFSDGLSEALIDALSNVATLRVPARVSSFSFKGKQVSIINIARQLNVGTVLEGSVRHNGAKLRITAQLIDARSGYQIWSKHYDPSESDLLKVQDEIATAVATAMQVTMIGDDATQLSVGGSANPKAFDAYLRGMILHNEGTPESVRQARVDFEAALLLDPNYALARIRHISCLILTAQGLAARQPSDGTSEQMLARALAEAKQVATLAPNLGASHTILGNALMMSGNFGDAGVEQARARALAPRDPWVNTMYGFYQALMGRPVEAAASAQRAADLDPLSIEAYFNLAQILEMARRPADALAALQRAKQLGSLKTDNAYVTYMAELEEGDAQAALRTCSAGAGNPACLAIAYHLLGRQNEAVVQLKKLRDEAGDDGALTYARIFAQWGRTDDALHWLERAYEMHAGGLQELRASWVYDPIRNTERFKEIERKMNFPS